MIENTRSETLVIPVYWHVDPAGNKLKGASLIRESLKHGYRVVRVDTIPESGNTRAPSTLIYILERH